MLPAGVAPMVRCDPQATSVPGVQDRTRGRSARAMRPAADPDRPRRRWTWWARWAIGVVTALGGAAVALVITAIGHCSAFGGRCPADPEPLLDNDVFGSVAVTLAFTVWIVAVCIRPNRTGAILGALAGLAAGVVAGLAAAAYAAG